MKLTGAWKAPAIMCARWAKVVPGLPSPEGIKNFLEYDMNDPAASCGVSQVRAFQQPKT
jgi:hypothetical protein